MGKRQIGEIMNQKILVTGAKGFVGRNMVFELKNRGFETVYECDIDTTAEELRDYCQNADYVFHFAGVNRPKDESEFKAGNTDFTEQLLSNLAGFCNKAPIVMTSSSQAALDNPYGVSKKQAEDLVFSHGENNGSKVFVFRLPGVFGKWCRPNYNSVVATFCHNIANGLPIMVNDPARVIPLVYIDDVMDALFNTMTDTVTKEDGFCRVPVEYSISLGELADKINSYRRMREDFTVPDMKDLLDKKLYSTYLSYLPTDSFAYPLIEKADNRGSFTEFIRTPDRGQVSVNVAHPGITKGNHWHHTKNEKFLVVKGEASIKFRKVGESAVYEVLVSDKELTVVDIPTGYTHNITNIGTEDLVTVMWANEAFDPEHPDTFFEKVETE